MARLRLDGLCQAWSTASQQQTIVGTPSGNSVVIGTHPGCDRRGLWGRGALPSSQTQQVQGFILPSGLQLDAHGGRAAGELEAEEKSAAWGWG